MSNSPGNIFPKEFIARKGTSGYSTAFALLTALYIVFLMSELEDHHISFRNKPLGYSVTAVFILSLFFVIWRMWRNQTVVLIINKDGIWTKAEGLHQWDVFTWYQFVQTDDGETTSTSIHLGGMTPLVLTGNNMDRTFDELKNAIEKHAEFNNVKYIGHLVDDRRSFS
jgi:hypothetical protein